MNPGFYSVVMPDHSHVTIRLREPDRKFFQGLEDGALVAAFFHGRSNDFSSEYTQYAFVFPEGRCAIWKRFRDSEHLRQVMALQELVSGDMEAAGLAYSLRSGRCNRCNRLLTNPVSIEAGIGPVCAHA